MPRIRDQHLLDQIGLRIQRIRLDRGLTQEVLAERVGIEPESLSRAESGARALSLSNLARVADALGVGLGDLLDVKREMPESEVGPDEIEWVRLFREVDEARRRSFLAVVRGILALMRRPDALPKISDVL